MHRHETIVQLDVKPERPGKNTKSSHATKLQSGPRAIPRQRLGDALRSSYVAVILCSTTWWPFSSSQQW